MNELILKKMPKTIDCFMAVCSIMISIICVFFVSETDLYFKPIIVLPIVYSVCSGLLLFVDRKYSSNIINSIVFSLFSVQYLALPLYILYSKGFDLSEYSFGIRYHIIDAVLLQSVVLVSIVLYLIFSKKAIPHISPDSIIQTDLFYSKWSKRLIVSLIFLSIALIALYPQFLDKFRLLYFSDNSSYYSFVDSSAAVKGSMPIVIYQLGFWLLKITKMLVVYYILLLIWRRSNTANSKLCILISTIIIAASCVITTDDKAATIFCAISLVLLIMHLYSSYAVSIMKISGGLVFALVFLIFIVFPLIKSNSNDVLGYKLNAYFSGSINVAAGFLMENNDLFKTFFGDFFRSIPLINHFFITWPMSYLEFNKALDYDSFYNSQIIPMISQGYYYFNVFGAIGYPIIVISFIKKSFAKMINTSGSYSFFVYSMVFVFSLLGLYLYDLALLFAQLLNYCLPLYILLVISRRRMES